MMRSDVLPVPGIVLGAYPERRESGKRSDALIVERIRALLSRGIGRYARVIGDVERIDRELGVLEASALHESVRALRASMAKEGLTDALVARAFAVLKRVCARELGYEVFPTQLIAARIMLDKRLAEMATGEGKTLAAAICAATAALAGIPVHVVTANAYLVTRDAELMRPLYSALGLSVGAITQALDSATRRALYAKDIVYCTASELAFDYLRDGLVRGRARSDLQSRAVALAARHGEAPPTLLRGLCMAIVDEADSILIDDARVPLILSERCENGGERVYLARALALAQRLTAIKDFVLHAGTLSAELTEPGRALVDTLADGNEWRNRLHRHEAVSTALAALHLFRRDHHYLVRDGAIAIIDEATGRIAEGRVWSRGLHRLIEMKEGCKPGDDVVTVAQITYQRFFQRYYTLCGMSGTIAEARGELLDVYGLNVVKVPLRVPDRRTVEPPKLYPSRDAQWRAVVERALAVSRQGRPVLIGTDSVGESEALSALLAKENAAHAVLNARQDGVEARVIAEAGQAGRITVATNMAGRGTDIALGENVAERGGLHVISCQHNASRRIDRQLIGRSARRGDPGSAETLLAVDKPLIKHFVPPWLARRITAQGLAHPRWLVRLVVRLPQWREERRSRNGRAEMLKRDLQGEGRLAFGRPQE